MISDTNVNYLGVWSTERYDRKDLFLTVDNQQEVDDIMKSELFF
jgi:hypothetical protein